MKPLRRSIRHLRWFVTGFYGVYGFNFTLISLIYPVKPISQYWVNPFQDLTHGEIINQSGLDRSMVSEYLSVLVILHIIREELLVTASLSSRK